jgi:hypothetical protein
MPRVEQLPDQDFWSDVYRGRKLAVFKQNGRWHAYLDHIFQSNVVFGTAESAVRWLATRVDGMPPRRAG